MLIPDFLHYDGWLAGLRFSRKLRTVFGFRVRGGKRCAGKCSITTTSRVSASSTAATASAMPSSAAICGGWCRSAKARVVEFQIDGASAREIFIIRSDMRASAPAQFGRDAVAAEPESTGLWSYFVRTLTSNYANFRGRARRKEYWGYVLFYAILLMIVVRNWHRLRQRGRQSGRRGDPDRNDRRGRPVPPGDLHSRPRADRPPPARHRLVRLVLSADPGTLCRQPDHLRVHAHPVAEARQQMGTGALRRQGLASARQPVAVSLSGVKRKKIFWSWRSAPSLS